MNRWNKPTDENLDKAFLKIAQKHSNRMNNSRIYFCQIEGKDTLHNITESGNYEVFTCMTPGCYHSKAISTK